jgi:hypothetical protein
VQPNPVKAFFIIANSISGLMMVFSGKMKWQENVLYIGGMPFHILSLVALNVFLFMLAAKQKDS